MYAILRMVFFGVMIILGIILLFRKTNVRSYIKVGIFAFVVWIILSTVSSLFPLENYIINFMTPQDVFNYTRQGKIIDIVNGENSSMLIFLKERGIYSHYIVPKSGSEFKIPTFISTPRIFHRFDGNSYSIFNVKGTHDYYLVGIISSTDKDINIVDTTSSIKSITLPSSDSNVTSVLLYSYIQNYSMDYYIQINGERIKLSK